MSKRGGPTRPQRNFRADLLHHRHHSSPTPLLCVWSTASPASEKAAESWLAGHGAAWRRKGGRAMAAGAPLIGVQLEREHFGAGSMGLARYGQK
jgi:hypothetical protein